MDKKSLLKKARSLPKMPGVYLMKNSQGEIIYIGKAKRLPNRVSSYFANGASQGAKVARMVSQVQDFDFLVTGNEFEALVLECNFIKSHRPKYNILLKDDKTYPLLRVSVQDPYPKLSLARKAAPDGARYFGPYSSSGAVYETIKLLQKTFRIATCSLEFPRDIGKKRPCLNYHIRQCIAPCKGDVSCEEYEEIFREVILFLEGEYECAVQAMREKMEQASAAMDYEKAARYRDRICALNKLGERQRVASGDGIDQDVIGLHTDVHGATVQVLNARDGRLSDGEHFSFRPDEVADTAAFMAEFVKSYYTLKGDAPSRVLLSHQTDDAPLLARYLSDLAGCSVELRTPVRGKLVRLTEMAVENARQTQQLCESGQQRWDSALEELQRATGLASFPLRIEAFDISNTGDSDIVGAMVAFVNGQPMKGECRRFRIKSKGAQNDYDSMREVLHRRLRRAINELQVSDTGEVNSALPDLLLVDGGAGHVSVAMQVMSQLGIVIPVFGMVKDDRHRTRALVSPEGEVDLRPYPAAFSLICRIQEEVHRFAFSYHDSLRRKRMKTLELEKIPGIGKVRAASLMKKFRTIHALASASEEALASAPGMTVAVAKNVWKHFHPEGGLAPGEEGRVI
jgi:excinuclease ABC subunit C